MIDLTPLDVRKKRGDFRRILRGYDPEEVDTFMDLVAERFEELVRENLSLGEKTEQMGRQLAALEGRERAVQEALVTAQKLRTEVGDQSRRDAEVLQEQASRMVELLKVEAETEIHRRLGEAEGLIRERQRALEDLERSRLKFLKSFRALLEREMDAVDVEESRRPLEETPMELEFRGWVPSGDLGFGIGGDEFEDDEFEDDELEDGEFEEEDAAVAEEEAPVFGFAPVLDEEPAPEEEVEAPAEEPEQTEDAEEPQDPWAAAAEFPTDVLDEADESDNLPNGFETQILGGAAPASFDPGAEAEEEMGTEVETEVESEDDPSAIPQEPRWLFSLLKKDEEKGGEA